LKALPFAACFFLLAACSGEQADDSFTANVADVEDVPADEGSADMPAPNASAGDAVNDADAATSSANTSAATTASRNLTGRWVGVEGMVLNVAQGSAPDRYHLEMQYGLDHRASVEGRAAGDGIAFERDGKTMRLRPTDGAATGLKWLDGKRDCLTVASGDGYCRA